MLPTMPNPRRVCLLLLVGLLALWVLPGHAAILVNARVVSQEFDGTTLTMYVSIQPINKTAAQALQHPFTGLVANMANSAAIVTYLKQQIAQYVSNQPLFGITATPNDVALWGAPQ